MPQLIRAEYLISDPTAADGGVIHDAALIIDGATIAAVGPWKELRNTYGHVTPLGGPRDWLALPGLVNAHHHGRGISTLAAGMPDAPLEFWLPSFLLYRGIDTYTNTLYAAARMLRSGITTSLHSHSSAGPIDTFRESVEAALAAYRDAGMRTAFALGVSDQQGLAYAPDQDFMAGIPAALQYEVGRRFDLANLYIGVDEYFRTFDDLHRRCAVEYPIAKLLLNPRGLQWASDELLRRIATAAHHYQTGVHLHVLETVYQRVYARRRFGRSAVEAMQHLGLLGRHVSIAHAIWITEMDIERLAATGTTVVTNPGSNLRLGSGMLPLKSVMERHVNLAIGLDSCTLFDDEDIFKEMRLIATLHRLPGLDVSWLSPYEVLRMATVGGARAALLDGSIGKLLPGYRADVTVLHLGRIRKPYLQPDLDVPAFAFSKAQVADVDTVLVEGQVLLRGGQHTHIDLQDIESRLEESCRASERERDAETRSLLGRLKPHIRALYHGWEPGKYDPYYWLNSRR